MLLNLKQQRLLVIAPHPDDEVLGCGGLIKRIKEAGGKAYILFITVGDTKDYYKNGLSTFEQRVKEIEKVASFLGYDDYKIAFPGNDHHLRLDQIPQLDLISEIENGKKISINKIRPTIIATPQPSDYNQDHRAVAEAVIAATRPAPSDYKHSVPVVLGYEFSANVAWSVTPHHDPNFFISLDDETLRTKVRAMQLYSSQARDGASTRGSDAIRSLALTRGPQCGVKAAEAFYSFKAVI
jgi:N-acetylglucosamine malate deacetylase 1